MKRLVIFSALIVCFCISEINGLKLPGPLVYVVTPSPRPPKNDEGRSAPFYYHNWMRRMDSPSNATTTTTTTLKTKTPDLIFAEFESGNNNMKSIRKLLERERIQPKTTTSTTTATTSRPIYVPDDDADDVTRVVNYGLPVTTEKKEHKPTSDSNDYFSMYNALYNNGEVPVYLAATTTTTTSTSTEPSTTTTITPAPINVENIWHIIDNEKFNQYSGKWEEEHVVNENGQVQVEEQSQIDTGNSDKDKNNEEMPADENFALPGFGTNPGNGAENESRAIRTEQNIRFPYVNLKPFQMKNSKKPLTYSFSGSKKGNNMFTSLDNFHDLKNPVRGEVQDIVPMRQPIDRYNPAQPYLPQPDYGGNSKQSSGKPGPVTAVANLVPPPPPPPPKLTDNDFPSPVNYDSFPPYAPAQPPTAPRPAPPALPPAPPPTSVSSPVVSMYQPPTIDSSEDSGPDSPPSDDDGPPMDLGYRYKQPTSQFLPTLPPLNKPFGGYSYDKPSLPVDSPPVMDMGDKPDFQGYHYSKPEPPAASQDHPSPSYGHHGPSYQHDSDYPDLIYDKPHGGMGDTKGGDDIKDAGMAPPPPPDTKPDHGPPMDSGPSMDDHGFPNDFPGDLKFHHDFEDDHDYHHHHHHHTTTTTTEQPRVNRYSYYYLGKKLYYLPLYFSVYFIVYVGALIIKAVLRHKIVYPNSWRPNDMTASFFSKRSIESSDISNEKLHDITGRVTRAIASAAEKYMNDKKEE